MKVLRVGGGDCKNCSFKQLECDGGSPKCSHCVTAGIDCNKFMARIAHACDRCRSKKIRCDGIQPSCTQCVNVGFKCRTSDKIPRRAFPRGYTESLEQRVRFLESETLELKDFLDEKDDKISSLAELASEAQTEQGVRHKTQERERQRNLETAQICEPAAKHLHVYLFEIGQTQIDREEIHTGKQSEKQNKIVEWIEAKTTMARTTNADPAIELLVIETPDDPPGEESSQRRLYNEVLHLSRPALDSLGISIKVLDIYGSAVFDESPPDFLHFRQLDSDSERESTYHIALGHFSLAFRYFPQSKSSVGILLVQNYMEVAVELLRELKTHQVLVGQRLLLPLLAQQAMAKLIASWLVQHKEVIIDAQAQTGYHHMVSVRKSAELMDYTHLSAKISGTAVNIATNELCWQSLAEHAESMACDLRRELSCSVSDKESTQSVAATRFMEQHASKAARYARTMLREAESWQKKSLILTQGIFNLIAQQDQNTSIGIARDSKTLAEESKRDSTSMKAIAIVTMTYLPGTFVAVCSPI
jgi:hypothetical protein